MRAPLRHRGGRRISSASTPPLIPLSLPPSTHGYKYRLYYGAAGVCRVRYDNERGKGDHRHRGEREENYAFTTLDRLLADFEHDVSNWGGP